MFLRCSYFFSNLSLNVLINMVLIQKKECTLFFFYKQWVYKHTEPQITDFLSISLSIFPASDLPMGKVLSQDFVYFVSEIEPGYDFFLSFVSSLLQMLEELIKIGN